MVGRADARARPHAPAPNAPDSRPRPPPSLLPPQGACGYGSIPKDVYPYFSVAALSPSNHYYQSDPLKGCGQCFQIQCEDGRNGKGSVCKTDSQGEPLSILVMISDVCPECEANHLDVQSLAFGKVGMRGSCLLPGGGPTVFPAHAAGAPSH